MDEVEPQSPAPTTPRYEVFVDDNFHYMDSDHRYSLEEFCNYETAVSTCRSIVDRFLTKEYRPGMTSAELFSRYRDFGEDPFVRPRPPTNEIFCAWTYARVRCDELCGADDAN